MTGTAVLKRMFLTVLMVFGAFVAFEAMIFTYLSGYCVAFLIAQVLSVVLLLGSPAPLFWRTDTGLKVVGMLWVGALAIIGLSTFGG